MNTIYTATYMKLIEELLYRIFNNNITIYQLARDVVITHLGRLLYEHVHNLYILICITIDFIDNFKTLLMKYKSQIYRMHHLV